MSTRSKEESARRRVRVISSSPGELWGGTHCRGEECGEGGRQARERVFGSKYLEREGTTSTPALREVGPICQAESARQLLSKKRSTDWRVPSPFWLKMATGSAGEPAPRTSGLQRRTLTVLFRNSAELGQSALATSWGASVGHGAGRVCNDEIEAAWKDH